MVRRNRASRKRRAGVKAGRTYKNLVGTRAEVMHGKARMTQGRLRKDDLTYNEYGQIVSKVRQKAMKSKKNPLRKLGLLQAKKKGTKKGTFGPKNKSNKSKNTNKNKSKKSNKKK